MKLTLVFIALIAAAILAFSALMFDAATVLLIGAAMALVAFFSGAAVTLGVITRRNEQDRTRHPSSDATEIIPDESPPDSSSHN